MVYGIVVGCFVGEGVDFGGDVGVDDGGMWVGYYVWMVGDLWLDLVLDDDCIVCCMCGEVYWYGVDDD